MSVDTHPPPILRYYLLRKPGLQMVPLIPVDQLPFALQDIPRQLTHRQLSDEGWKLLDETSGPVTVLSVLSPMSNTTTQSAMPMMPAQQFRAPDFLVREAEDVSDEGTTDSRVYRPVRPVSTSIPLPNEANSLVRLDSFIAPHIHPWALADSLANIRPKDVLRFGYRPSYPSGIAPDPSKKIYCSHWIRTGECDYTAQGCKFKHEMPSIDVLREIGLRSEPRWYKDKMALDSQGMTWMQRRSKILCTGDKYAVGDRNEMKKEYVKDPSIASNVKLEANLNSRTRKTNGDDHGVIMRHTQDQKKLSELPIVDRTAHVVENLIDFDAPSHPFIAISPTPSVASCIDGTSTSSHVSESARSISPAASSITTTSAPPDKIPARTSTKKETSQSFPRPSSDSSLSSEDDAVKTYKQHHSCPKSYLKKSNNSNTNAKKPTPSTSAAPSTLTKKAGGLAKSRFAGPVSEDKGKDTSKDVMKVNVVQRNAKLRFKTSSGDSKISQPSQMVEARVLKQTRRSLRVHTTSGRAHSTRSEASVSCL